MIQAYQLLETIGFTPTKLRLNNEEISTLILRTSLKISDRHL